MNCKNKPFFYSYQWLASFVTKPPALPENYLTADFTEFMRRETYLFSPRYAKKYVTIHGQDKLFELTAHSGVLLTPLHYGSFFLSGGAIAQQLKLHYTAIVTGRNLASLSEDEQKFWKGVHQRSTKLYQQPLFFTGTTSARRILNYLAKPGNLLCAMLDVREIGNIVNEFPFIFLKQKIYLQTGPARLACLAKVPLVPMCIQYNTYERRHHLHFGSPIMPEFSPIDMTQQALTQIETYVANQPQQFFYDMDYFLEPHA